MIERSGENDSHEERGGWIPGAPGSAAFVLSERRPSAIPILIAAPHGGRDYPRTLMADLRHGPATALKLEDRHIDAIARRVAELTGASLLIARAPRAMIDLNRAPDDVDWEMFVREARPRDGGGTPSRRARSGLGLIPRRLPATGELWRRRLQADDLSARIAGVHEPYHAALAEMLARLRDRWGAALLIDLHSMPPLPSRPGVASAQLVVGDRFGASCHGSVVAATFAHFAQVEREAAHNRPYAGGYVLERHADPRAGLHAMQIEIDRSRYLDSALVELGEGTDGIVADLSALVRRLAALVAELGRDSGVQDWQLAAE
ncbi:N-formylglutamate amidohydrolase [Novosphingobium resinovorum]|uniref:N-formylglutamate amidohydrolase n=1 Tax=Novosphingobium resinovorum TaxID=158500 RepID=UPI002ED4090B|nr:N-formylglutamate amidohydrolase [Novosphingobium resinovorum]